MKLHDYFPWNTIWLFRKSKRQLHMIALGNRTIKERCNLIYHKQKNDREKRWCNHEWTKVYSNMTHHVLDTSIVSINILVSCYFTFIVVFRSVYVEITELCNKKVFFLIILVNTEICQKQCLFSFTHSFTSFRLYFWNYDSHKS